jgi:hypothetical protein
MGFRSFHLQAAQGGHGMKVRLERPRDRRLNEQEVWYSERMAAEPMKNLIQRNAQIASRKHNL